MFALPVIPLGPPRSISDSVTTYLRAKLPADETRDTNQARPEKHQAGGLRGFGNVGVREIAAQKCGALETVGRVIPGVKAQVEIAAQLSASWRILEAIVA